MFKDIRAALTLARSLKRIADALDEQNRIRKFELSQSGLVLPDPTRKFTATEAETEVSYESIAPGVEGEEMDEKAILQELKDVFSGNR